MNLYEVVFWGSNGDGNAEDTIYLVRAPDFRAAVDEVQCNGGADKYKDSLDTRPHKVHEVGRDLSPYAEKNPCILRGPYFAFACNFGRRSWSRKVEANEWIEDDAVEPQAPSNASPTA